MLAGLIGRVKVMRNVEGGMRNSECGINTIFFIPHLKGELRRD
jgi:hypothetical protein